ncbi:BnaC02g24430D [Brassica napus]|uniref:BnaC02g24430D protein n=1 Tax=Brassica napus TaxID=3708 RepID=A0A078G6W6_BRANA|nr:BnaC02g24430D [Brassica napus]
MLGDRLASVACSGSGLDNRYYVYAIRVFSDLRMVHWMEGLRLSRMSLVVIPYKTMGFRFLFL